jgi:hypothetical protein
MKKLNTTYLDNLVSKVLKETLEEKVDSLVSKIKGGSVCECGGTIYEGECNECGSKGGDMYEDIYDVDEKLDGEFDYVTKNESTDEDKEKTCRYHIENFGKDDKVTKEMCQGVNITEALKGRQRKLDRNKNNKIDAEDFKMLRKGKKTETDEGNAFSGALSNAKKSGEDSFEVDGKEYPVKESYSLTETEMISLIEKIVKEEKDKNKTNIKVVGGSPRGLEKYKQVHTKDGKQNDDYIKSVAKKMKDYLKDGSKGDYDMNPKTFPVGNGELEKMDKKAFQMTDDLEDFNYEIAGLNLPTPDAIEFNEDFMEKLYKGDSTTGNAPGGNALESKANDRFNKLRKKNTLKKLKDQSYNRVPQPVFNEKSGTEKGKGVSIKLESTEDKKTKQINEEFDRMKSLIGYDRKTQ